MTPQAEVKVVGRCIVCGDMVVQVMDVDVSLGMGIRIRATEVRRCGCGEFVRRDAD